MLRANDSPTICNVIEVFNNRSQTEGYMDARIQACFPEMPPMVGYATTATFRSGDRPRSGDVYAALDEQIKTFADFPQPVVVVFQDLDSPAVAATFGEVMTTCYKSFGAAGMITSGAARDLDQVRAIGFPCFSDGVIAAHGYPHFVDVNVPVRVGGVDDLSRRFDSWRLQRRDDDSPRDRFGGGAFVRRFRSSGRSCPQLRARVEPDR